MLPISSATGEPTGFIHALFTATSAVSLTGLVMVDTATHWSLLGQVVIVLLIQMGGFGIMSLTTLAGLFISRKVSLRSRRLLAAEGRPVSLGGARRTLKVALLFTAVAEALVAVVLAWRLWSLYDVPPLTAAWHGIFHAISAFNNAGFSLYSDNLIGFASDWLFLGAIMSALVIGGLGVPVVGELFRRVKGRWARSRGADTVPLPRWSVTTRVTLGMTAFLIVAGALAIGASEWNRSLAHLPLHGKLISALFQGVTPRTAGFNTVDYADMSPLSLMMTDVLMFIGGGSAGTAGGIKVTTAAVLAAAMWAEFQGEKDVIIGRKHIPPTVIRQSLTVAAAGVTVVALGVGTLLVWDPEFTTDQIIMEVVSAFGTVGLSTGITAHLSNVSALTLVAIMYLGRLGPITLVAALAAKSVVRHYDYPEERPFIG